VLARPVGRGPAKTLGPRAALVLGTTIGGAFLGAVLVPIWFAIDALPSVRPAMAVGVAIAVVLALVWPGLRRWLPGPACQVQEERMAWGSIYRVAFDWGVELGLGVRTFVVTPALFMVPTMALLQPSGLAVLAIPTIYGFVRGATIACFAALRARPKRRRALPGTGIERRMRIPLAAATIVAVLVAL
jgi:hypothetical protein